MAITVPSVLFTVRPKKLTMLHSSISHRTAAPVLASLCIRYLFPLVFDLASICSSVFFIEIA